MLPFTHNHDTDSIEHMNTWLPYMDSNISLVTAVMICTDTWGGIPFLKMEGEGDNYYLDHDIVHRVSCGWKRQILLSLLLVCYYIMYCFLGTLLIPC
jgi:hypothetical protein